MFIAQGLLDLDGYEKEMSWLDGGFCKADIWGEEGGWGHWCWGILVRVETIFEGWVDSDQTGSDMEELFPTLAWLEYQESYYA